MKSYDFRNHLCGGSEGRQLLPRGCQLRLRTRRRAARTESSPFRSPAAVMTANNSWSHGRNMLRRCIDTERDRVTRTFFCASHGRPPQRPAASSPGTPAPSAAPPPARQPRTRRRRRLPTGCPLRRRWRRRRPRRRRSARARAGPVAGLTGPEGRARGARERKERKEAKKERKGSWHSVTAGPCKRVYNNDTMAG
jgi:hypothetical protein